MELFHGTDGIVTLENLVECLIGEIHDEYDPHESDKSFEKRTGDYRDWETDRKSTRLNSSHSAKSRMPSSA